MISKCAGGCLRPSAAQTVFPGKWVPGSSGWPLCRKAWRQACSLTIRQYYNGCLRVGFARAKGIRARMIDLCAASARRLAGMWPGARRSEMRAISDWRCFAASLGFGVARRWHFRAVPGFPCSDSVLPLVGKYELQNDAAILERVENRWKINRAGPGVRRDFSEGFDREGLFSFPHEKVAQPVPAGIVRVFTGQPLCISVLSRSLAVHVSWTAPL